MVSFHYQADMLFLVTVWWNFALRWILWEIEITGHSAWLHLGSVRARVKLWMDDLGMGSPRRHPARLCLKMQNLAHQEGEEEARRGWCILVDRPFLTRSSRAEQRWHMSWPFSFAAASVQKRGHAFQTGNWPFSFGWKPGTHVQQRKGTAQTRRAPPAITKSPLHGLLIPSYLLYSTLLQYS